MVRAYEADEGRAVEATTLRVRAGQGVKRPALVEPMMADGGPAKRRRVYAVRGDCGDCGVCARAYGAGVDQRAVA